MPTTTATARARAVVVLLAVVGIVLLQSVLCGATVALPGCCPLSTTHAAAGSVAGTDEHGIEHSVEHGIELDAQAAGASSSAAAGTVVFVVSRAPAAALFGPGMSEVLGACLLFVIAVLAALAGMIGRDRRRTPRRPADGRRRHGRPPAVTIRLEQLCVLRT